MKISRFTFFCVVLLLLVSCSSEEAVKQKVLAKVNNYEIYLDDFRSQLAEEVEYETDYKLTEKSKREFLNDLIRKELLIQEAKRMDLDREDEFVKTIERYWESTLVRNLIAIRSAEISKKILVSEEEIEGRIQQMRSGRSEEQVEISSMRPEIEREIREAKKSAALQEWIEQLQESAKLEIDSELLKEN
nr:SurA N-terminal domain-containing protein [Desulfobulbaceae bacterium]